MIRCLFVRSGVGYISVLSYKGFAFVTCRVLPLTSSLCLMNSQSQLSIRATKTVPPQRPRSCMALNHRTLMIRTFSLWDGMVPMILLTQRSERIYFPSQDLARPNIKPLSWSYKQKWAASLVVSSFTFISPISSSMVAPATKQLAQDFGETNTAIIAMMTSIFVLGYG